MAARCETACICQEADRYRVMQHLPAKGLDMLSGYNKNFLFGDGSIRKAALCQ
jgi:hypothetical protein